MDSAAQDVRRSPRSKVLLSAVLEWPERSLSVVLRDLSEHGALIETAEPIAAGSKLYFRRNDLRVPGRIAWAKGRFAGIAFVRPLKAEEVLRQISRPAPRRIEPELYRRPALIRPASFQVIGPASKSFGRRPPR